MYRNPHLYIQIYVDTSKRTEKSKDFTIMSCFLLEDVANFTSLQITILYLSAPSHVT